MEAERQGREQADRALQEKHSHVHFLEEKIDELQRANAVLHEELRLHTQASAAVPQEEDFGEALFPTGADGISVYEEHAPAESAPLFETPATSQQSVAGEVPNQESAFAPSEEKADATPEGTQGNGHESNVATAEQGPHAKKPHEWISFN